MTARVRAPQLHSRGAWFNTAPLTLADLRGKIVLLDFWTSCCANCLHVLDELRPLEERYDDVLVVIGVHSPKFTYEAADSTVAAAIGRYEIVHPVLSDPDMRLWQQYAIRAWPTLVVVDPEGYVVAQAAGEGQASSIDAIIADLVRAHEAKGTLRRGVRADPPVADPDQQALRFPAKAIRVGSSLLVADAGHHQIVELALDGRTVLRRIGAGRATPFTEPNGLALLPSGELAVADTAAHVLRIVRDGEVARTVELDRGLRTIAGPVPPVFSPWDVAWWPALERLVVAAAGVHLLLSWDPVADSVEILAGTTVEGLRDGPALDGWLAQPSALAVDGDRLWFLDAETSALRWLTVGGELHTAVGEGLFDFGHVDGPAAQARFQHPLGLVLLGPGELAVLDTYNGAVRHYRDGIVSTLADGLAEPSGAVLVDSRLLVVESAAHRLVDVHPVPSVVGGPALSTQRPVTELAPGRVVLTVRFTPAPGRVLDERDGPATRLAVGASPLLRSGAGESSTLLRELDLVAGDGVLAVVAQAASCDDDPAIEHPACHLARQDWGIPVRVMPGGATRLDLVLLGE